MDLPAISEPAKTEWTEDEYLEGIGLDSELRYEYVRGRVYAMATPTAAHAEISSNLFVALHRHLRGKPCRVFKGEMALRINFLGKPAFYIPDVMVACDDKPLTTNFREEPVVLVEVMSPATMGNDLREKLLGYSTVPSLRHYLVVNQHKVEVYHYQPGAGLDSGTLPVGWKLNLRTERAEIIHIPELEFSFEVGDLYLETGI